MPWEVFEGELIEWLEHYDGPRFHGIVSDPPYALISITKRFGKKDSAPAQEGSDGRFSRLSGGFMGQKWDGFESLEEYQDWIAQWADMMIASLLYPGAVCLFFGGTRTFHHLGVGLERGGFEITDTVMWLHGQGFPKSHEIVEGYGTALKPAWEPIFMARAPRKKHSALAWSWPQDEYTFAQLQEEFGTGALNIDGSRISGVGMDPRTYGKGWRQDKAGDLIYEQPYMREGRHVNPKASEGRWPANLTLSHSDDCIHVGDFEVEGRTINRFTQGMMPFGGAEGEEYESEEMPPETVERWACVPGCPVRMLDDQAGDLGLSAGVGLYASTAGEVYSGGWSKEKGLERMGFGDKGGPSRFFYTSKSSRAEKDKGLEDFYWARTGDGFVRITVEEWNQLEKNERARGCIHPTVKPLDLTRYLGTLILPPKQDDRIRRILIPFSGSGSEIIGAIQAGWDEVNGVEMEPVYNEMAEARVAATIGMH